jgi:signal transduction histidine kinase
MSIIDTIKELLFNPNSINVLIAIQIPIVLVLAIQGYQAYKLGFKEFKYISIGWGINFIYTFVVITIQKFPFNPTYELFIRTLFDLLVMSYFLRATLNSSNINPLYKLPKNGTFIYLIILALVGIFKTIPSNTNAVPFIHMRYIPSALMNIFVIYLLALFFKNLAKQYQQRQWLFYFTLLYAIIQILAIAQTDKSYNNAILFIDNIGFSLGLFCKTGILVSLSFLIVNVIQSVEKRDKESELEIQNEEKNKLLHKLNFATKILNLKERFNSPKNINEQENEILKQVLDECLMLLNENLGYYASYNDETRNIQLEFTSDSYIPLKGYKFPDTQGITGKAIRNKHFEVMKSASDTPEYFRFEKVKIEGKNVLIDKNVKSAVALPIIDEGIVKGVYVFESEQENYFSEIDVQVFNALVSQALAAIKNINLLNEIESSKTFIDSLKQMDKNLVDKSFELESIFNIILKQSLNLAKGTIGFIALKDKNNRLNIVASTNLSIIHKKIDINDSISGLAVMEKKTRYIHDIIIANENEKKLYKDYLGENLICELVVPLIVQNEVIGVFATESNIPNAFSKSDVENVEIYAGQTSVAIQIAQLFDAEKNHRRLLETLAEINLLILSSNQVLSETLDTILKKVLDLLKKEHGNIILLENGENGKEILVVKKSSNDYDEGKIIPSKSVCGLAIKRRQAIYIPFIDKIDERPIGILEDWIYLPTKEEKKLFYVPSWGKLKSEFVVPLVLDEKVIGVLNIESNEYDAFSEDERNSLKNLVLVAANAIRNAKQFEEINAKNKALANSVDISKIQMSAILGKVIDHRIGNSVGAIRTIIKDKFLYGQYGKFDEKVVEQFKHILANAEKVLSSRTEIKERIDDFLSGETKLVYFEEIKQLIEQNEEIKAKKHFTIQIDGFDNLKGIYVNLNLIMEGVFFELIGNAIKSMPGGGIIEVRGKVEGRFNVISIIDKGYGIDPQFLKRIFDPGVTKWDNNPNLGEGKGLNYLKAIIDFYGGKVKVDSNVGYGTTFTIRLPISKTN